MAQEHPVPNTLANGAHDPICRTVNAIAAAWTDAGRIAPDTHQLSLFGSCVVPDCSIIPFATLRTVHGLRAVCLIHFVAVEQVAGVSLHSNRRKRSAGDVAGRHRHV